MATKKQTKTVAEATSTPQQFVHNPEFDAYQAVKQFMEGRAIHPNNTSEVSWVTKGGADYLYQGKHLIATFAADNYQLEPWSDDEEARRVRGILLSLIQRYGLKHTTVFRPRGQENQYLPEVDTEAPTVRGARVS